MNSSFRPAFFNPLLPALILGVGLTGAVGVGMEYARHQISVVANQNRVLEARIAEVQRQSEQLDTEIAEEQDTRVLLARESLWKLGLAEPSADRVHAVAEDPLRHLSAKQGGERPTLPPLTGGLALLGR